MLAEVGLLEPISGELHRGATEPLWRSLAGDRRVSPAIRIDARHADEPILLGSLLVPLGISLGASPSRSRERAAHSVETAEGISTGRRRHDPVPKLGALPLARRDVERLRQILGLQRRLRDVTASPRAQRALAHRSLFREALTWFEIHGGAPELVENWKAVLAAGARRRRGRAGRSPEPARAAGAGAADATAASGPAQS